MMLLLRGSTTLGKERLALERCRRVVCRHWLLGWFNWFGRILKKHVGGLPRRSEISLVSALHDMTEGTEDRTIPLHTTAC